MKTFLLIIVLFILADASESLTKITHQNGEIITLLKRDGK